MIGITFHTTVLRCLVVTPRTSKCVQSKPTMAKRLISQSHAQCALSLMTVTARHSI
ncbi:Uncharacterised protein [Vibrio cholerae]|nr:Uncharacterised protein [Vibrio cholerae]CSI88142.1 Uncharacterised protein [Vibrio cholerae]